MSCKHGNHELGCDLCDAEDDAYARGYKDGLAAVVAPEGWIVEQISRDDFSIECPGAAKAVVSVMSHDPAEMLLAFIAEMMVAATPANKEGETNAN